MSARLAVSRSAVSLGKLTYVTADSPSRSADQPTLGGISFVTDLGHLTTTPAIARSVATARNSKAV